MSRYMSMYLRLFTQAKFGRESLYPSPSLVFPFKTSNACDWRGPAHRECMYGGIGLLKSESMVNNCVGIDMAATFKRRIKNLIATCFHRDKAVVRSRHCYSRRSKQPTSVSNMGEKEAAPVSNQPLRFQQ